MKARNDFAALRAGVCTAATKFFAACRKKEPKAEWLGLAVCPDDDLQSAFLMADHRKASERRAAKLIKDEGAFELPPEISEEMFRFLLRIDASDWACSDNRASDLNKPLSAIWSNEKEVTKSVRAKCLKAIVSGLQDFERAIDLTSLVDRDEFLLLVTFPDPDTPSEVRKMAKELNPPKLYKRFDKAFRMSNE